MRDSFVVEGADTRLRGLLWCPFGGICCRSMAEGSHKGRVLAIILNVLLGVCIVFMVFIAGYFMGRFLGQGRVISSSALKSQQPQGNFSEDECFDFSSDYECPNGYDDHPLIILSMDGFRNEYLTRELTNTIQHLGDCGVEARYMRSVFPTKTFVNHYSIVTGLYPESHGIIDNKMYDPVLKKFKSSKYVKLSPDWWRGEPIWNTVTKQGKRSATYYWPGSEVDLDTGRPTYREMYNDSMPFKNRVDKVFQWLDLPAEHRPKTINLYFHQPDRYGHHFGPNSYQVNEILQHVDGVVKYLVDGLTQRGILGCVNLVMVADHGMAATGCQYNINITSINQEVRDADYVRYGSFGRIRFSNDTQDHKNEMIKSLQCKNSSMRVWDKKNLPRRWHYFNTDRIEDIVLELDPGYNVIGDKKECENGSHGYDNRREAMRAIFMAHGPAFKKNYKVPAFMNIELYNLFCHLAGVKPSPNNGTEGSLYHILNAPPAIPRYKKYFWKPYSTGILKGSTTAHPNASTCGCSLDQNTLLNLNANLNLLPKERVGSLQRHLPWGVPEFNIQDYPQENIYTLTHRDSIVGYSTALNVPSWISYTITRSTPIQQHSMAENDRPINSSETEVATSSYLKPSTNTSDNVKRTETKTPSRPLRSTDIKDPRKITRLTEGDLTIAGDCWIGDVRLSEASNCTWATQTSTHVKLSLMPNKDAYESRLISSVIPAGKYFANEVWTNLENWLEGWSAIEGSLNVQAGPVYDHVADGHKDTLDQINALRSASPLAPSHVFVVVTRCLNKDYGVTNCPPKHLDSLSFILPNADTPLLCEDVSLDEFLIQFSAKISDVELVSGLKLFPGLSSEDAIRLRLQLPDLLWHGTQPSKPLVG